MIYDIPPILTVAILAGLAVMAMTRARHTPANRLLIVLCLLGSLLYLEILITFNAPSKAAALRITRIGHLFHPFLIPLFIHFFHTFLGIHRRRWLVVSAYIWAGIIASTSQTPWLIAGMGDYYFGYFGRGGYLYWLMGLGAGFVTVYNLFILHRAIRLEADAHKKNKLKYVFTGFGLTGVLTCLNIVTMFGIPIYPLGCFGFIPLGIFGAGVLLHDLLDMGVLIRKSLIYSMLTGLLTGLYALAISVGQYLFGGTAATDSLLFPLILFTVIVIIFGPVKTRSQKWLDRMFARNRYNYQQTIKSVSRTIATILDYDAITRLLEETVIHAMGVTKGALYLRRKDQFEVFTTAGFGQGEQPLPQISPAAAVITALAASDRPLCGKALENHWPADPSNPAEISAGRWRPEIALPMRFKDHLKGFLFLGAKRSGDLYSREDLDLLETLSHQSALAIENTRAYQALNTLNRELEKKVTARTRDLSAALAEKERTQEQLIRSESLAALGQLVAGVAHELNNPLASVTSLLQSIQEEVAQWRIHQPLDPDLLDDLQFADKELARAKAIVASLLGLARQTQTYQEAVDMNLVIGDALRILHNQYKHSQIELNRQFEASLPTVQGNFANLGQVALNIIQNAFQAVPEEGGWIELGTYFDPHDRQVVFYCQDNGPGIASAIRQDVFKPFFTTKPVGQGTGLGLYLCHEIVTKHDGTIAIASDTTGGTRMTVRLPTNIQRS